MDSKKMIFLILHYKNIEETKKCIDSIDNIVDYKNKEIVVVDNGSNNGTFEELQKIYNQKNIYLLKSNENLGFARGNNLGFVFAKENLNPEFIIMINSDILLIQKDFCDKVLNEYAQNKFDILGPDIVDITQKVHSNPNRVNFKNKKDIEKRIESLKMHLFLCKFNLEYIFLIKNKIRRKFLNKNNVNWEFKKENDIELHGSCLIFSQDYIKRYNGISPETFLYYEESFLYYISQRDKLKMLYSPNLKIVHNESKSTKKLYKKLIKRKEFYYKNSLDSCEALLKLVIKDKYWG